MVAKFGPMLAGHPAVGDICCICREPIKVGDYTTLLPGEPADEVNMDKCKRGSVYDAVASVIHWDCSSYDKD